MYDFNYSKPDSIPDAVKALEGDPEAKPLAGGQTFIPVLKQRLAKPTSIVDLSDACFFLGAGPERKLWVMVFLLALRDRAEMIRFGFAPIGVQRRRLRR